MRALLTRLGAHTVALGAILARKTMIACGLRRPPEGWRRTVGILLRSEPTRFALSAFGLHVDNPDEHLLAERLRAYLERQPDAHYRLEWHDVLTVRQPSKTADVVLLRFGADGELQTIEPVLTTDTQTD